MDGVSAERIGNGLYITRSPDTDGNQRPFTMSTPNSILSRVLSSSNFDEDVNGNPINFMVQCNDGLRFLFRLNITYHSLSVTHSVTLDDYYVQFKGDNNGDGTGTYVEIMRPGLEHSFNTDLRLTVYYDCLRHDWRWWWPHCYLPCQSSFICKSRKQVMITLTHVHRFAPEQGYVW